MEVIKATNIKKTYVTEAGKFTALNGVSLTVSIGEYVALMGPSGSGKSTLMNMLGLLDTITSGELRIANDDVSKITSEMAAKYRNTKVGFVFQGYNLLPRMTALQNIELPFVYRGVSESDTRAAALNVLEKMKLSHLKNKLPSQMSGGQQQRIAIARAIAGSPAILLADEPTGNLDTETSREIMDIFSDLNRQGTTIVLVTHEPDIALYAKRHVRLVDGKIVEDRLN